MKGFIELQDGKNTFSVAVHTIAAVTKAHEDSCVITFTQSIPTISNDNTVFIKTAYHQVLDMISAAQ